MNRERIEHAAHERVHFHMKVGFTLFAAIAGLTVWRRLIYTNARNTPGWGYFVASLLMLGLTLFQGYLGGELVFADGSELRPPGKELNRLAKRGNARRRSLAERARKKAAENRARTAAIEAR